jgi:peptide/nickel transport system ATP-binding protein
MIAIALACEPKLLIADEPTTALDVTIQKQILELIDDLRLRLRMSVILVTHDLGVIADRADRVAVMYAGEIAETTSTGTLLASPRHPYTEALFHACRTRPRTAARRCTPFPVPPRISSTRRRRAGSRRAAGTPPTAAARTSPGCSARPRSTNSRAFTRWARPRRRRARSPPRPRAAAPHPGAPPAGDGAPGPLLTVEHLVKDFPVTKGAVLQRRVGWLSAVADVSFTVRPCPATSRPATTR